MGSSPGFFLRAAPKAFLNVFIALSMACCGSGPLSDFEGLARKSTERPKASVFSVAGATTLNSVQSVRSCLEANISNARLISKGGFKIKAIYRDLRVGELSEQGLSLSNCRGPSDVMVVFHRRDQAVGLISLYAPYPGWVDFNGTRVFTLGAPFDKQVPLERYLARNNGSELYYRDSLGQVLIVGLLGQTVQNLDLISPECVVLTKMGSLSWRINKSMD